MSLLSVFPNFSFLWFFPWPFPLCSHQYHILEFPIPLFSTSHFPSYSILTPLISSSPTISSLNYVPFLFVSIYPCPCFLPSFSVSLSCASSLCVSPHLPPFTAPRPLPTLSAKAYSPEFYFDTPNPTRSHKLSKNYSYVLQWTQREPDAVDPLLNYRLSVRQVGQGGQG